jgi:hypothetical protein
MALPRSSRWLFRFLVTTAATCAPFVAAPGVAQAQVYVYPPPPPPPPPPPGPPDAYYYRRAPAPESRTALALGVDLEGAVPVNVPRLLDGNNLSGGDGIKIRLGAQMRVTRRFRFTPEVGYGYEHLYAYDNIGDSYAWDTNRLFAGARLAFGDFIVPSVYGHFGYGWRTTGDPTVPSANGLALDVGGALDIRLLRELQFGIHAEWATIEADPYAPEWIALGGHVDMSFF